MHTVDWCNICYFLNYLCDNFRAYIVNKKFCFLLVFQYNKIIVKKIFINFLSNKGLYNLSYGHYNKGNLIILITFMIYDRVNNILYLESILEEL